MDGTLTLSNHKPTKIKKIHLFVLVFLMFIVSYFIFEEEKIEIIKFSNIPGISPESVQYNNKLFKVDEYVIYYPERKSNKYHFKIDILSPGITKLNHIVLECDSMEFDLFVNELIFLDSHKDIDVNIHPEQIASGGIDAIKSLIIGLIDLIKDPLGAGQAILSIGKDAILLAKDITTGNITSDDLKRSIDQFATMFWFNTCATIANENKFDYEKSIVPSTNVVINSMAKNRIVGRVVGEVAILYFSFAKASMAKEASKASKFAELARLFRFTKSEKLIKPVAKIGTAEVENHGKLVEKYYQIGAKNKAAGIAREEAFHTSLQEKFTPARGYKILREQFLRDVNGNIVKDPLTGEARRVDFAVTKDGMVIKSFEVTSTTAPKEVQMAKEVRIRQSGGNYVKDSQSGQVIAYSPNVLTEVMRFE